MSPSLTAVAMSGGVDSSVAASLLASAGRPLVGFSMKLVDRLAGEEERYGRCCSPDDFADARRVADRLGFPHFVLDMEDDFRERVLAPFARDYAAGRTPSPCVRCNSHVKFDALLARARAVGAGRVATGHYAVLARDPRSGRTLLRAAADREKDQSYFLFDLSEAQRAQAEFPLGGLTKDQVRANAREAGLPTAEKPESMDLCFVSEGESYRDVLARAGEISGGGPGEIVDGEGRVLARHPGIERFTVGQRRGLGISGPDPLYVVALDAPARRVVVGEEKALYREKCRVERVRWIPFDRPMGPVAASVRIRSGHAGAPATIDDHGDGTASIRFAEAQRAIAPGQAAVFYDGDLVLGGGWIAG
ncbi:MAG TPA: tRNA 2-thiouridine(34) synthase MnmA [Candidatus Sulfotelmatobacter sp.]|jgi:tRNA-specific 2-thiouridylase|nr:tRNA 2-thiouridine(34) synthase MnmA [Candidatus Sulfotelmatobacter sp.]